MFDFPSFALGVVVGIAGLIIFVICWMLLWDWNDRRKARQTTERIKRDWQRRNQAQPGRSLFSKRYCGYTTCEANWPHEHEHP